MPVKISKKSQPINIPKSITIPISILSKLSPKLTTTFAAKLFGTPIKYKIPKREFEMDKNSIQKSIFIPSIKKSVVVYEYGQSEKKILLVHGWSGRGTQLAKIADVLLENGYSTISFDAPAHGKSPGKQTIMLDFIACVLELEKVYGFFYAGIGHSLGGISLLNAARLGFKPDQIITIGAADKIEDIIKDFTSKLKLNDSYVQKLKHFFEKKYKQPMNDYSAFLSAAEISIPVLLVHDNDDAEVPVYCAHHIYKYLKKGSLFLTDHLGHKKILGSDVVIKEIISFLKST